MSHIQHMQSLHEDTVVAMAKLRRAAKSVPDIRERFGDAVRHRREELGLNQEELAHRAGIHRTYLSDIERGQRNVALVNIENLARALELKMSELFAAVEPT